MRRWEIDGNGRSLERSRISIGREMEPGSTIDRNSLKTFNCRCQIGNCITQVIKALSHKVAFLTFLRWGRLFNKHQLMTNGVR